MENIIFITIFFAAACTIELLFSTYYIMQMRTCIYTVMKKYNKTIDWTSFLFNRPKTRAIWLVMPLYIFSGKFAAKLKILLILPYWCGHVIYWALQCLQDTWVLTSLCQLYLIYVYLYIKLFVISLNYIN